MKNDGRIKRVGFAEESLREAYDSLKEGRFEDRQTYEYLDKAFDDLEKNPYAGIKVPGSICPKSTSGNTGLTTCGSTTCRMAGG